MAVPSYIIDEMRRIGVQPPPAQPSDLATTTKRSSTPGDWNPDQLSVARRIYDIGRQRNESDDAIRAALSTGVVESEFNPRALGDRDNHDGPAYSVFQQRKVGGYDTQTLQDPDINKRIEYGANAFYDNARKIKSYRTPGLLAAQVQRPRQDLWGRYDQEMPRADTLFKQFSSGSVVPQHVRDEIGRITGQTPSPDVTAASTATPTPTVPDHVAAEIKRITSFTPSDANAADPTSPDQAVTNTLSAAPASNESNVVAAGVTASSVRQQRPRAIQPNGDIVRTETTVDNPAGQPLNLFAPHVPQPQPEQPQGQEQSPQPQPSRLSAPSSVTVRVTPQMNLQDIAREAHRQYALQMGRTPQEADSYANEAVATQGENLFANLDPKFLAAARKASGAQIDTSDPRFAESLSRIAGGQESARHVDEQILGTANANDASPRQIDTSDLDIGGAAFSQAIEAERKPPQPDPETIANEQRIASSLTDADRQEVQRRAKELASSSWLTRAAVYPALTSIAGGGESAIGGAARTLEDLVVAQS